MARETLPSGARNELLQLSDTRTIPRAGARGVVDVQRRIAKLAERLADASDPRGVFASAYKVITDRAVKAIRDGEFTHREWAEQLVTRFAARYLDNLHAHLDGGKVSYPWRRYYAAAQGSCGQSAHTLGLAIIAHLVDDLPETLAEIGSAREHREDFMLFGEKLLEVSDELVGKVKNDHQVDVEALLNGFAVGRFVDARAGSGTTREMMFQTIRIKAWARGQELQTNWLSGAARAEIDISYRAMADVLAVISVLGRLR